MPKVMPTELEKLTLNAQGWNQILSDNMRKLNDALLKISGMLDADLSTLEDGAVLVWNASSQKWVATPWDDIFEEETTTT
ncbi:hypothetical protein [Desulfatiglans anilini]|uniref:hypothetical protein n=1 Tax=Desulfatiglans anilini TaxID=90728 RepID=UPI000552FBF9|nr:hypothetical protein [Desulfatiglans anilini]